ncbi:hypothetical protein DW1_0595 [Proteiniborus sp. DW1]|nr:hypothetical protein DW1_0595 [Proteiniborus sp. DW1]
MEEQNLHSTLVLLKVFPDDSISNNGELFTFYSSSIKGMKKKIDAEIAKGFTFYSSSIKGWT